MKKLKGQVLNMPTPQMLQHHTIVERSIALFAKKGLRILSQVEKLYIDNFIDERTFGAAVRFRDTYDIAGGVREQADGSGIRAGFGPRAPAQKQLDALAATRAIRVAIGAQNYFLVEQCVAKDASWRETGTIIGAHHEAVKRRTIKALQVFEKNC
jgi:hypothetical protein